jgi:hypothetical protein
MLRRKAMCFFVLCGGIPFFFFFFVASEDFHCYCFFSFCPFCFGLFREIKVFKGWIVSIQPDGYFIAHLFPKLFPYNSFPLFSGV